MMSSTLVGSEGQGIRTVIAHQSKPQFQGNNNAFYSAHFSNFAAAATSNNTHNENLSAPPSSSASSSREGGDLNFFPLHSSMENASPAYLGLEKAREKVSVSEVSMGRVMGVTSNNGEGIACSNPFDSASSFAGFLSRTDGFNTPQKSTPLGGAETFRPSSSTAKVLGSSTRPRLVKVRRNNSGADVGKSPAAFSGGNFKKGSLNDEVPGYNPFRSDQGNVLRMACLAPFSKGIGDSVVNQVFKPRHNVGMKEFSSSLNKDNDDLNDQMRSWKPIVGGSEVKSSGGDASINSFSFPKKFESVGLTFKAGIDDKAAKSSVAKEGSIIGAGLGLDFQFARASQNVNGVRKVNDIKYDGSFSFGNDAQQANESKMADAHPQGQKPFVFNAVPKPQRRIGSRHRQQDLRSNGAGDAISSRTIHGSSSCGQSTIDNLLASQSPALKNGGQSSIDDSFSFQSSGLKAGGGQSTFDTSLPFNSSGLRNGEPSTFDTSFVSESSGLKNVEQSTFGTSLWSQPSWQSTFATSFVSQSSLAKSDDMKKNASFVSPMTVSGSGILQSNAVINLDNPFASQTPQSVTNNASYSGINSFGFTGGKPNSSTFIFNAGGKVESERDEIPKPNHSGEVGGIPSSAEGPTSRASSPEKNNSWPSMESLSSSLNQICGFNADKGVSQNSSARKKRDKSQFSSSMRRKLGKHSTSKTSKTFTPIAFQANSAEGGSPMDFSPYSETSASATCKGKSPADNDNIPDLGQSSVAWATPVHCSLQTSYDLHESLEMKAKVDELRAAAANLHIGADKETSPKTCKQEKSSKGEEHHDSHTGDRIDEARQHAYNNIDDKEKTSFSESDWLNSRMEKIKIDDGENASIHCSESEWLNSKMEKVTISDGASTRIPTSESEWLNSRMEKMRIDDSGNAYGTLKAGESYQNKQFTFGASSSVNPTPPSRLRRHVRRFHQVKGGENLCASNSEVKFGMPYCATHPRGLNSQDAIWKGGEELEGICNPVKVSGESTISYISSSLPKEEGEGAASSRSVKSAAAEEACEKWRLRGNQAYANGDFPKAEDCYSRGASSVSPNETSESCIRASMLCYSNRAATRMAVGRMREALADCMRAMAIDPNFLRVQIRAASCHLSLGESESAVSLFKRCLRSANDVQSLDLKIASEASDGLRKAQQGWEYTDRAADILDKSNPGDASNALHILNEALSISPYSERLLGLKALCLLNLRKYEEVIQVCEQSMDSAERNFCLSNSDSQLGSESLGNLAIVPIKLWRWRMSAKAYFHLGKLEEALDLLVKYEELNSAVEKSGKQSEESLASFMAMIRDLLRHKVAGNNAFQAGKHAEAVEHYTAALACNGESWPFTAVCFCNRAAAFQALGHVVDAIADCSRAISLDPNYPKAISRRATLHEMVRDYGQAATDLERLITLLEKQQRRNGSSSNNKEIFRQTRERLGKAEEEMKRGHSFDHYLILGVEASSTGAEIKKAYRRAALRHHPDKAGQFLVRSDSGDDSKWRELGDEVRRDAERLFKMIGEAYAILSDSSKRLRYDTEEELRKLRIRSNSTGSEAMPEACRYQCEKGNRRQRDRWDSWDGYSNLHQRWQSGPDAAQPDTYARRGSYKKGSNDGSRSTDWDYL